MFLPPKMPCAGLTAGKDRQYGDMVKLAATLDSNPSVERRIGSNPIIPTSSCADERMANSTGKSERRLTAGQTAFICRSDGVTYIGLLKSSA